jgi:hypothetical protein
VSLKSNRHVNEASHTLRPHRAAPLPFAEAQGERVSSATDATLRGARTFRTLSSTERATHMRSASLDSCSNWRAYKTFMPFACRRDVPLGVPTCRGIRLAPLEAVRPGTHETRRTQLPIVVTVRTMRSHALTSGEAFLRGCALWGT